MPHDDRLVEAIDPAALGRRIEDDTTAEVFADDGTRALYSSDASNYRMTPALVVAPRATGDLAAITAICGEAGVPMTMRGGGTSIAGNAIGPGVVVDTSRHLTAMLDVDPVGRTVTVEPGAVLEVVNRGLRDRGLRIGPDPSSGDRCTIGGMIGNNACGIRSVRWGTTADAVRRLDLALPGGGTWSTGGPLDRDAHPIAGRLGGFTDRHQALLREELPAWSRRVSGYALDRLLPERGADPAAALVGAEGTCAVVLGANLGLVEIPKARVLAVLGFPDDVAAAAAVPELLPLDPLTLEGITAGLFAPAERVRLDGLLPEGEAWLLAEADGAAPAEAADHAARLAAGHRAALVLDDPETQARLWRLRKEGSGRATRLPDGSPGWPGLEDAAVPPGRLAAYLEAFHTLMADHGFDGTTYGHFGEGCLHVRIGFDLTNGEGIQRYAAFMDEAAALIVQHGGSLSGEHGDGRARGALLPVMYSPEMLAAFAEFRAIWDPAGVLNPGVLVDPAPITESLRPAEASRIDLDPFRRFGADGDLRHAVARCVGVGACVSRTTDALMCPSYQATGRERDSTRGRARTLQEMIAGGLSDAGWRSQEVREALDLCLACKGCVDDCPTSVDVAAYKSEFLAHHYRGRLRPRIHYSLGRLPTWLRLGSRAPGLVNLLLRRAPRLVGLIGGFSTDRPFPPLARRPFTRSHPEPPPDGGPIVLWPDSFNDHLSPEVLVAGHRVLVDAGYRPVLPEGRVCCGLTRITTGQLDGARRELRRTLDVLGDGDAPIVVLEPSCAAALRTDLPDLLPGDSRAARLAERVLTFAEALGAVGYEPPGPPLHDVLVQPHCHQQAVLGIAADEEILKSSGAVDAEVLTGCCGLAGDFGMDPAHREVADAVAGLRMLPALERTAAGVALVADGFSCRTQIGWLDGRRARHLAEVLAERLE